MGFVARLGEKLIERCRMTMHVAAVLLGVLHLAVRPRVWVRTVRDVLARQILFTGIEAISLTAFIAVLAGVSIVAQTQLWLNRLGQSGMLGSILVVIIVREVAPLLVNLVVIGRSGTAIATEMAYMTVRKEIDVLDAQGLDPMVYVMTPRVIGVMISVLGLSIFFCMVAFASGYGVGFLFGVAPGDPVLFISGLAGAVSSDVLVNMLLKTILPGLLTGTICCVEGLSVKGSVTEVPQAVTRAVVRSIATVLLVSAIVSVLSYV